jgi:hypothetical protein
MLLALSMSPNLMMYAYDALMLRQPTHRARETPERKDPCFCAFLFPTMIPSLEFPLPFFDASSSARREGIESKDPPKMWCDSQNESPGS